MKFLKRILFILVALVTLVVLFHVVENWRGNRAYQNARKQLEALGEELDFAAFVPESVPEPDNFGSAPFFKDKAVQTLTGEILNPLRDLHVGESRSEFEQDIRSIIVSHPDISASFPQEPLAFLEKSLEPFQPIRQQLTERLSLPHARWNASYDPNLTMMEYPVLSKHTMSMARLLAMQGHLDVFQGNGTRALEDVGVLLRIAEMYTVAPSIIYQVMFLADLALTFPTIEHGLARTTLDGCGIGPTPGLVRQDRYRICLCQGYARRARLSSNIRICRTPSHSIS
ncbi:MAG: hypothetical protein ACI9DF_003629 [Verrucomicrobiales bacterium]|jgi:hypothetical protein